MIYNEYRVQAPQSSWLEKTAHFAIPPELHIGS